MIYTFNIPSSVSSLRPFCKVNIDIHQKSFILKVNYIGNHEKRGDNRLSPYGWSDYLNSPYAYFPEAVAGQNISFPQIVNNSETSKLSIEMVDWDPQDILLSSVINGIILEANSKFGKMIIYPSNED